MHQGMPYLSGTAYAQQAQIGIYHDKDIYHVSHTYTYIYAALSIVHSLVLHNHIVSLS